MQLPHDRLAVNWRQMAAEAYPRYEMVRADFQDRFADLAAFVTERALGALAVTQVEVTYINAIDIDSQKLGRLDALLRNWHVPPGHLGEPEQARLALVFPLTDIGTPPVRLYVSADPAQRSDGSPTVFFTLTARGAPADEGLDATVRFLDAAHEHIVRSFTELTTEAMHVRWERKR